MFPNDIKNNTKKINFIRPSQNLHSLLLASVLSILSMLKTVDAARTRFQFERASVNSHGRVPIVRTPRRQ